MPGPERLKAACSKCKRNKWITDFHEKCFEDITRYSTCIACSYASKVENLEKMFKEKDNDVKRMKAEIEKLEQRVKELEKTREEKGNKGADSRSMVERDTAQKQGNTGSLNTCESECKGLQKVKKNVEEISKAVKENRDTIVESGKSIVEMQHKLAAMKGESQSQIVKKRELAAPKSKGPHNDGEFKKVSGRQVARPRSMKRSFVTPTSNRFTALAEEEGDDTLLIGDSMVRLQSLYFGAKNRGKRTVVSYPGAGTGKVCGELKKLKVKSRNTTVIVQSGGNDLFLRPGETGETEPVIRELEAVASTLAGKTDRGIMVGVLPRLNSGRYALSKAISLNDRLKVLCENKGVQFLNPWDTFITNRRFFRKDGIHFSVKGAKLFGDILSESVFRTLKYDFKGFESPESEN